MPIAVVPIAGNVTGGIRELSLVNHKPIISHIMAEIRAVGITTVVFVTNQTKSKLNDYIELNFGRQFVLNFVYQDELYGTGSALMLAQRYVEDSFYLVFPDVLVNRKDSHYLANWCAVPTVMSSTVGLSDVSRYGIITVDEVLRVRTVVEKPNPIATKSNLALVGRYLLNRDIFPLLDRNPNLSDCLGVLARQSRLFTTVVSEFYDCGTPEGHAKCASEWRIL